MDIVSSMLMWKMVLRFSEGRPHKAPCCDERIKYDKHATQGHGELFPLFTAACMLPACCLMLPAAAWLALCFSASCFHACSFLLFSVSHCSFLPFAAPRETNAPTNKQTIKQTDKQTNQQTIKLTNKQIQADTPFARYTHAPPQLYLIC